MSKTQVYPGLYAAAKAAGVNYVTARQRVLKGMSVEEACSMPVRKMARDGRTRFRTREDHTPVRIQKLRAEYCDKFVATGVLDEALCTKLADYAEEVKNAKRSSSEHLVGISTEHAPVGSDRREHDQGNLGDRGLDRIDEDAARRIAQFLRTE
jgi:hypothetical protein